MRLRVDLLALMGCVLPVIAVAEEKATGGGSQKTAVYMQAGYSSGSMPMGGAALGGLLVRDLTSRLSFEAAGSYLGHGMGASGLGVSAALLVHLAPNREKAVPYLVAGGGLYRASFDMGQNRFQGPGGPVGSMMDGYGRMGLPPAPHGPAWDYGQMPHFYGRRLDGERGTGGRLSGHRSFTDPAFTMGGGVRIDLGSRLYLRPDARALIVTSSGRTDTLGVFTVNLGYRF